MSTQRPALFIGSSSEGLDFARAVRTLLKDDAEVQVWRESMFGVAQYTAEALLSAAPRFDFAVLVLSPDDVTSSRHDVALSPRDNVIFELGLFMGSVGRLRTFMVRPGGLELKLPSDLAGITTAEYHWPRADMDPVAALGAACDEIRRAIRGLGFIKNRMGTQIGAV